jgi:hypothetical protein
MLAKQSKQLRAHCIAGITQCFSKYKREVMAYGTQEVNVHIFLNSALEVSGQIHAPVALLLVPIGKEAR